MKGRGDGEGSEGMEDRKLLKGCVSNGGPSEDENGPTGIHDQGSQRESLSMWYRSDRF